ncbi:MAG: hypothetical protein R2761_23565 [Acidimicrobiales bacterium]
MAGKNEVILTLAGDSSDLEKAFDRVGSAADDMAKDVKRSSDSISGSSASGFDSVGEGADVAEQRIMGFRDGITGVQDSMSGFKQLAEGDVAGGLLTMGMGLGDLASSVSNLVVPMAKTAASWVTGHASMAVATASSVATQVASWAVLGVQSMLNAAKVAAAWLISMGPIILVGAAVVGLVVLIVKNWDTIKEVIGKGWDWVKDRSKAAWDGLTNMISSGVDGIKRVVNGVADILLKPFRDGFDGIKSAWNNTIGGKGFGVPSWVPGMGGKEFRIPKLARGGIVTEPTLALIGEAGPEQVMPLPPGARNGAGSGPTVLEIHSGGSDLDNVLLDILRKAISARGGDVQLVLG